MSVEGSAPVDDVLVNVIEQALGSGVLEGYVIKSYIPFDIRP